MLGIGKPLIIIGIAMVAVGLACQLAHKLGLGSLPGDIVVKRGNFTFVFPFTTCILVSAGLTIVLWLIAKITR